MNPIATSDLWPKRTDHDLPKSTRDDLSLWTSGPFPSYLLSAGIVWYLYHTVAVRCFFPTMPQSAREEKATQASKLSAISLIFLDIIPCVLGILQGRLPIFIAGGSILLCYSIC